MHSIYKKISTSNRIVLKIGTNVLMQKGCPDTYLMQNIIHQISILMQEKKEIALISSGAIGFGASKINVTYPIETIPLRQACAAVGQPHLMMEYTKACANQSMQCAQMLLTKNDFDNPISFRTMNNCLETLFKKKCLPIINENDSVATDEIDTLFGDNDRLSAMIAKNINADLLILLTDVDALYDQNPHEHPHAHPIDIIENVDFYLQKTNQKTGSSMGTGGMYTKLLAAKSLKNTHCIMIIAYAKKENILLDIVRGTQHGSVFIP